MPKERLNRLRKAKKENKAHVSQLEAVSGILLERLRDITKSLKCIAWLLIARCIIGPTDEGKVPL